MPPNGFTGLNHSGRPFEAAERLLWLPAEKERGVSVSRETPVLKYSSYCSLSYKQKAPQATGALCRGERLHLRSFFLLKYSMSI